MSIKSEVARIELAKADIKSAIEEKGGQASGKIDTFADAIRNLPSGKGGGMPIKVTNRLDSTGAWVRPSYFADCDKIYEEQYNSRRNCLVFGFDCTDRIDCHAISLSVSGGSYKVMLHDADGVAVWDTPKSYGNGATMTERLEGYGALVVYTDNEANISSVLLQAISYDGFSFGSNMQPICEIRGHQYQLSGIVTIFLEREKRKVEWANNFIYTWYNCYSLQSLDLSSWDTTNWNITLLTSTWQGCYSLQSLDLSSWDTSNWNVTSLAYTWQHCYSLQSLNLSSWNTSNWSVTSLQGTWQNCYSLQSLDLSNWNTSNWSVTSLLYTWYFCYSLQSLDLSNWNTSNWNETPLNNTWSNCYSLHLLHIVSLLTIGNASLNSSNYYSRTELVALFNELIPTTKAITLTFGATNLSKLSASDKAIATSKGYTLA